ncbi:MAG: STAS domain-containing protein [Actinomycetota bacterium]
MATADLDIDTRIEGDWRVVAIRGEVDLYTSPQLREAIERVANDGVVRILVDLTGVSFMDSSGLGVLVGSLKRSRERGGDLALVCQEGSILRVLTITGLDRVFPIHASVADAVGA